MEFLRENQVLHHQKVALRATGLRDLSYEELYQHVNVLSQSLKAMGIEKGDAVGFVAGRDPVDALISLALLESCVLVPINPESKSEELANIQKNVALKAVVSRVGDKVVRHFDCMQFQVKAENWNVSFVKIDEGMSDHGTDLPADLPTDTCLVLQTSGTTALPRFVPLTRENILASCDKLIGSLALQASDVCLHMLPLFHVGGLIDVLLAPLRAGSTIVMNKGFDRNVFFSNLQTYQPTWTQTVPAMLQELVAQDGQGKGHCLRFIRSVSAPLSQELHKKAQEFFDAPIVEIYGMSETCGVITSNALVPGAQKSNCVGASAGLEVRLYGDMNEVQVRGASVMSGYLNGAGDEFQDGWLKTGDLGRFDEDGDLYLTGRIKDIINRGGEKISPAEIDQLMLKHGRVIDAAAFPIPSEGLGEEIALAVVARDSAFSLTDVRDWLKDKLAYFKVPSQIMLVDEIPRHKGKLQRRNLIDLLPVSSDEQALTAEGEGTMSPLAVLWAQMLEIDHVDEEDDFFDLGGDSLVAVMMMNEIEARWGVPVLISIIYDEPVLKDFERHLFDEYPELKDRIAG